MADVEALLFFLSSSQSYVICFALCRFISHPWNQEIIKLTAFSFVILHPGRKVSTPWVSRRPCSKSLCLVILCLKGSFEFHLLHWQSSSMVFASFSQQLKEVAFKTLNLRIKQVLPPPATNFCLINALKNRKPHNNQTKGLVCRAVLTSPMPLQRQQMRRLRNEGQTFFQLAFTRTPEGEAQPSVSWEAFWMWPVPQQSLSCDWEMHPADVFLDLRPKIRLTDTTALSSYCWASWKATIKTVA